MKKGSCKACQGDLDLYDIVLHTIYDGFVDALLVGITAQCYSFPAGVVEDFLVAQGDLVPVSLVECPEVFSARLYVQTALVFQEGDLDEQFGVVGIVPFWMLSTGIMDP